MNAVTIQHEMTTLLAKEPPDQVRTAKRAQMFLDLMRGLSVKSNDDCEQLTAELRLLKTGYNELEAERKSFTEPLNAVVKKLNAKFMPHLHVYEEAEKIGKDKIAGWLIEEQTRIADERKEAERAAAQERQRLAAEAQALRAQAQLQEAEQRKLEEARQAQARAEQARVDAEAAAAKGKAAKAEAAVRAEAMRQSNEAAAAEAERVANEARENAAMQAAALEQTAAVIIAQPVEHRAAKPSGISMSIPVDYELMDIEALGAHVFTVRKDLSVLFMLDDVKMRNFVKLQGLSTNLPGLRVFPKPRISQR